jgi:hypothetical protein
MAASLPRVLESVAVIGVDNDDVLCNVCGPRLTSR